MSLRLPPFGADLMRMRRAGMKPVKSVFGHIVVATDWDIEGDFARVVVPQNLDPEQLDFAFCAGLEVCLAHRDGDLHQSRVQHEHDWLEMLVLSILDCDPARLDVLNLDREGFLSFLRKPDHA
jgi:hypothetical protein